MTPQQVSEQDDDVVLLAFLGGQQVGEGKAVNVQKVEIKTGNYVNRIRAANTPTGMADRIAPRDAGKIPITVVFTGPAVQKTMRIRIYGESNNNGTAGTRRNEQDQTLANGDFFTPAEHQNVVPYFIQGLRQTNPGHAGNLWVGIFHDGENDPAKALVKTSGFSVAAIPVKIDMEDPQPERGQRDLDPDNKKNYLIGFGADYKATIISDSHKPDDLDKVQILEVLQQDVANSSGSLKMFLPEASGWLPAAKPNLRDAHTINEKPPRNFKGQAVTLKEARIATVDLIAILKFSKAGAGKATILQYFVFSDQRTGVTQAAPAKVPQSGFSIVYEIKRNAVGKVAVYIKKTPQANNGVMAGEMPQAATVTIEAVVEFVE